MTRGRKRRHEPSLADTAHISSATHHSATADKKTFRHGDKANRVIWVYIAVCLSPLEVLPVFVSSLRRQKMLECLCGNWCLRVVERYKSTGYFLLLLLAYVLYLFFGAVVFSLVELPYENLLRQELIDAKQQFLRENECLSEEKLEAFLARALQANNYGVSVLNNNATNWNWDFTSALFFASTVLSTTGESGHRLLKIASCPDMTYKIYSEPFSICLDQRRETNCL